MQKYNKDELIELVKKVKKADRTEDEIDFMVREIKRCVLDPNVTDLIFWSNKSAEEIIEIAMSYKPIIL